MRSRLLCLGGVGILIATVVLRFYMKCDASYLFFEQISPELSLRRLVTAEGLFPEEPLSFVAGVRQRHFSKVKRYPL
jgi:hypothetical protein